MLRMGIPFILKSFGITLNLFYSDVKKKFKSLENIPWIVSKISTFISSELPFT